MDGSHDIDHLLLLLKKKFISPYKIIYLIDQKQADHFKARNIAPHCDGPEHASCCVPSTIWIPSGERSQIERVLVEELSDSCLRGNLNAVLEFCEDRYQNIVEKGKSDALKVTTDVQKYLIDNILSEVITQFLYQRVMKVLGEISRSTSS